MTDASPADTPADDDISYRAAVDEIEEILRELEHEQVDVDQLATTVGRAAHLIAVCRDRIDRARAEVTQVVVALDETVGPSTGAAGSASSADAGEPGPEHAGEATDDDSSGDG